MDLIQIYYNEIERENVRRRKNNRHCMIPELKKLDLKADSFVKKIQEQVLHSSENEKSDTYKKN